MKDRRTSDACVTRYSMWDVLRNAYVAVVPILIFAAKTANAIDPPNCSNTVSLRWSRTSDRLYLEAFQSENATATASTTTAPSGGGCTNLSAIVSQRTYASSGNLGPLFHFNRTSNTLVDSYTGDFFLNSSMYIQDNVQLDVFGPAYGGDVNTLYLRSDPDKYITIRAHGGRIRFKGVTVQSFNRYANNGVGAPDWNVTDGRSFVNALSEVVLDPDQNCTGGAINTMGEARMDIHDSTFAYLGYGAAESYGISYKVRGLCQDFSNLEIMDEVSVWGDITDSEITNLYFGHYSYGHEGGNWSGNHVHHNYGYGFDPHDDSDGAIISNNHVHHNGWHGIIASKRCNGTTISGNIVHDNGKNGIMLHRSSDNATIANNEVYRNGDSGIALYESSDTIVYGNDVHSNYAGIRLSMGSSRNEIYDNTFDVSGDETATYAIFMYRGSDEPEVFGSDGTPTGNLFYRNTILGNAETMKIIDTTETGFQSNILTGNFTRFRNSTEILWSGNSVPATAYELKMEGTSCFVPTASVLSESSGNPLLGLPMCES